MVTDRVRMVVRLPTGEWHQVREWVTPQTRPGSFSSEGVTGRHVYLFGWIGQEMGLWRSLRGYDFELDIAASLRART